MNRTKQPYEAPALARSGDVIETTRNGKISVPEPDLTGMFATGSVGFGV